VLSVVPELDDVWSMVEFETSAEPDSLWLMWKLPYCLLPLSMRLDWAVRSDCWSVERVWSTVLVTETCVVLLLCVVE